MAIVTTDPFSQVPVFIKLRFGEQELTCATAFFYKSADRLYLVSNWHVFSGRDPKEQKPVLDTGGVPDTVSCCLILDGQYIVREWHDFALNQGGKSLWLEHPKKRHEIDIGLLPVELPSQFKAIPINDLSMTEMQLRVSDDVFVLGYPLGLTGSHGMPLWKRASVASEPGTSAPHFLVDTATRSGMSGSPVVQRYRGYYKYDTTSATPGSNDWLGEGDSFVGVYSGRLGASQIEAQLGIVWKEHLIKEIIDGQCNYER